MIITEDVTVFCFLMFQTVLYTWYIYLFQTRPDMIFQNRRIGLLQLPDHFLQFPVHALPWWWGGALSCPDAEVVKLYHDVWGQDGPSIKSYKSTQNNTKSCNVIQNLSKSSVLNWRLLVRGSRGYSTSKKSSQNLWSKPSTYAFFVSEAPGTLIADELSKPRAAPSTHQAPGGSNAVPWKKMLGTIVVR